MAKISTEGMTVEEKMAKAEETAKNYFRQGLNCSECVFRAFMDMHDSELPDSVIRLASGFGGGMGHTKNTCGAITGAVMALGMVKGRDPFESDEMKVRIQKLQNEVYPVFGDMVTEIKDEFGTLICKELSDPFGDFEAKTRKRNCMHMIGYCASIAEKYANM